MSKLNGTILIQGASRGIGLAMVERLLDEPGVDRVIATARSTERSDTLQRLRNRAAGRLLTFSLDVTREADVARVARETALCSPRLHGMINTAGVLHEPGTGMRPEKRIEDIDVGHLETVFRVNAFGPMLMAKHFFHLLRHEDPTFFASLSARVGSIADNRLGGWYGYRAAKAAQNQFTRTLAVEASRRARHLRVLALHPGTTDTRLSAPFQRNVPQGQLFTPDFVADRLLSILRDTDIADNGRFIAWDGKDVPW